MTMAQWMEVGSLMEIPQLGGRYVDTPQGQIALLRNEADEVFAVENRCPHRGGPLAEGFVSGRVVFCPLHNWQIDLNKGEALPPDAGCVKTYPVRVEEGQVYIALAE
ncbi:MAG: nitrite reductase small subunit NirD [Acidithiobacillus sp.]